MSSSSLCEDLPYDEFEEEGFEDEGSEEPSVYYTEDFISGPRLSDESTLPGNILEFDFSFGYDCKRYYNLTVADEETLIFASGNLINFFNVNTKELWFRRSAFGGGIGHITKNPNADYKHIAVGENGIGPPIIVYEWPSLEIVCLLKEGTSKSYSHLSYSPDGMLLVSQGGEPDYLITIFTWTKSRILLRTKSYVNDVFRVMFSPDVPGQLTSCGLSHIKFWKMAQTFTGLKLQGELGRFGKTEYSDILGIYPMPDEKVLSGSAWGNILMWDEGLIKLEVCRKLRKTCHDGAITQFFYTQGDLWTVGMDGRVRVWFYDTIDQADPPDDDRFVQVEPIYDFHTPGVQFMCIFKQNDDPKNSFYYAQDGNGGLWRIDLNTDAEPELSEQLYRCHAGPVVDLASCPWGPYLASLGIDGRLQLYQYINHQLLFVHQYPAKGGCMLWLPLSVQPSGDQLVMGFDDGILRVSVLKIDVLGDPISVKLSTIQVVKPHGRPVTKICLNDAGNVLVSGSEDATVFVFQLVKRPRDYALLVPIGYVKVPGTITYLTWHHAHENTLLAGCIHGDYVQVQVPAEPQDYTTVTYVLLLEPKMRKFMTYKSQIRRDIKVAAIEARKAEKLEKKKKDLEQFKKDNPGLDIDEELFLQDSEPEIILEPLFIPEIPNRVLWIQTTNENTIWLSMGGFDAGYIYEYYVDQPTDVPAKFQIIYDGDNTEISHFCYSRNKKYLILAMQDGSLRVVKLNPDDWRDWSDYWQLSVHDNYNGFVNKMCFSYDDVYFFTCGNDGNIFSFRFYPEEELQEVATRKIEKVIRLVQEAEDTDGYTKPSLEEAIVRKELDRQLKVANDNKRILRDKLAVFKERFQVVLGRNAQLPATQIIPRCEFEIDPRITSHLDRRLEADQVLVKRKLAFPLEKSKIGLQKLRDYFTGTVDLFPISIKGINVDKKVIVLRQRRLTDAFNSMLEVVEQKIIEDDLKNRPKKRKQIRPPERPAIIVEAPPPLEKKERPLEYFLIGLSPSTIRNKLGARLSRLLAKYRQRKLRIEKRQEEWDSFESRKPKQGINDPKDELALKSAIETIGDYKLKTAHDYKVPQHLRVSTVKKYKQLLHVRLMQYKLRNDYNTKVYALRDQKVRLRDYLLNLQNQLSEIHEEISETSQKFGPEIPIIKQTDFNERNLEVNVQIPKAFSIEKKDTTKTTQIVKPPKGDVLEKEVLTTTNVDQLETADFLSRCMQEDSAWESQVRDYRKLRKLFDQDYIIKKMKSAINEFDAEAIRIFEEHLRVTVDATYIDAFISTLYQELVILRDFESVENKLQEKVHARMEELLDMKDMIQDLNGKIEFHKREIERLQDNENEIQQQFLAAVVDNKFYDFLRRIFRKKYKPPKVHGDDESSSEESSSDSEESEEVDAGSVDSKDIGVIRLDENTCPKGCDQNLYNLTFELRTKRHGVELQIKDEKMGIDSLRKDLDVTNKRSRVVENNLKVSQTDLEAYQREKQRKLNEVMCTVIVRLNQLQHLVHENECNKVKDTLVFLQSVLSKLYKRVGELYQETLQQKAKHKSNINHLVRMRTDCKHMDNQIEALKAKIVEKMKIKFGCEADLDELEEVQLKRMVFELRLSQFDVRSMCEVELSLWNSRYVEKQTELARTIKDNTSRLELLAVLNREKAQLARIIGGQSKKRKQYENVQDVAETYRRDLSKLAEIVRCQSGELRTLKIEIERLRSKGPRPEPSLRGEVETPADHVERDEWTTDWQDAFTPEESQIVVHEETRVEKARSSTTSPIDVKVIVAELIAQMVSAVGCSDSMSKTSQDLYVPYIAEGALTRGSVYELIDYLIAHLPIEEPTDEQQSIVETTAEKIFALRQGESATYITSEILDQLLDQLTQVAASPPDIILNTLSELVQKLPLDFLSKESSVISIANKVQQVLSSKDVIIQDVIQEVLAKLDTVIDDVHLILNKILERMFGTGIDYLFYIKH